MTVDPRQAAALRSIERLLADPERRLAEIEAQEIGSEGGWQIAVLPTNPAAAQLRLLTTTRDDDEVVVYFGHTHVYLSASLPSDLVPDVEHIAEAVFAGRFAESGGGDDAFVRIEAPDGAKQGMGRLHLPWPWRWRRTRSYEPYDDGGR